MGANAAVSLLDNTGLSLVCDELDITMFRPTQAYLAQALQDDLVKAVGRKLARPPLYMVTGLMVASGVDFTSSRVHNQAVSGAAQADATSLGVPLNIGPEFGQERSRNEVLSGVQNQSFILAYQLIRIRRKRDGSVEERDENRWALFSDDDTSFDRCCGQNLYMDWDITWTDPEHLVRA